MFSRVRHFNNTLGTGQIVNLFHRMAQTVKVDGFDACMAAVDTHTTQGKAVYVMFSGGSWCPDCVSAEPVVNQCVSQLPDTAIYIYCAVGGRDFWKDKTNIFRTNDKLKINCVPTLVRWGKPQKLEESQCSSTDLVQMLMEDD